MEDSSVFSVQWSLFPSAVSAKLTPEDILMRYLAYVRRVTFTIVSPRINVSGVQFNLFGSNKLPLISFLPSFREGDDLVIRICGGILVQRR